MKLPLVFTPVEFKHKNIVHIIITDVIMFYIILNCKDHPVNFGTAVIQFAKVF